MGIKAFLPVVGRFADLYGTARYFPIFCMHNSSGNHFGD
jgi:hypothetical protein